MEPLESVIKRLPPHLQQEAIDFIQFLIEKHMHKKRTYLRLDWAGAPSEYRFFTLFNWNNFNLSERIKCIK
ncbi:MAG: DUF2281 domain-containing protein [Theionarchaea archaeon]|nr:DUF2281 domain-containing protein [Theionarchaea archaeon]